MTHALARRQFIRSAVVAGGAMAVGLAGMSPRSAKANPGMHASWTHGTALKVESPENLKHVGYYGWGGDMLIIPGKSSWFHIPIPTPVIVEGARAKLGTAFMMFRLETARLRAVHIYDGSAKVQEFNDLSVEGEHRLGLDGANTFKLAAPHTVSWGIGLSFLVVASIGFDSAIPPARLIVEAAGGDFFT